MAFILLVHTLNQRLFITDADNLSNSPRLAKQYPTREEAETAAVLLAASTPHFLGKLEVREYKIEGRTVRI